MDGYVDITGLDKATLLAALYNRARPTGLGLLIYSPEDMTVDEARRVLQEKPAMTFFDIRGRTMRVTLSGDFIATRRYNDANGPDAAEEVVRRLRAGSERA